MSESMHPLNQLRRVIDDLISRQQRADEKASLADEMAYRAYENATEDEVS